MEGELLISGVVTSDLVPELTPPRYTHAVGEVYARTWYEQSAQYPLTKEIRTPTRQKNKPAQSAGVRRRAPVLLERE